MKNFALIGAAGYIAPKHMKAIQDTSNTLMAAYDVHDSVGILDSYFPETQFFTEFERFDRFINKVKIKGDKIDYFSICSPNHLHDAHCRFALRNDADVICEKPLVLNPWNIDALQQVEKETGRKIFNILQLRLHPSIIALREKILASPDQTHDIDLTYCTSRGNWYHSSWKGDLSKSGGIATNIGIHFFDMLLWIFGQPTSNQVHVHESNRGAGYLKFANARVKWFLSVNYEDIPQPIRNEGKRTYRTIRVDGIDLDFSAGFTDLHTQSYLEVLEGNGFGTDDIRETIQIIHNIRNAKPIGIKGDFHPILNQINLK